MSESTPYTLVDCAAMRAAYPRPGDVLTPDEIAAIGPGTFVKLIFFDGGTPEAMWVRVTSAGPGQFTGTLDNAPAFVDLEYGQEIEFTADHIAVIGDWPRAA